jgi:hypothetical protein
MKGKEGRKICYKKLYWFVWTPYSPINFKCTSYLFNIILKFLKFNLS